MPEDYVLDDSEYEVIEEGDPEPITSEEVKQKLESPFAGPIEQEDFDDRDYTLLDYLTLEEGQYPRNIRENKGSALATMTGAGLTYAGVHVFSDEPVSISAIIGGFLAASYFGGIRDQDMDLDTALENSKQEWSNRFK